MRLNRHHRLAACALIAAGVIAGGCGSGSDSPGVPSAGSHSDTTGASPGASRRGGALAFARCMRTHGLPTFPDPTIGADGSYNFSLPPGLDLRSAQSQAARQACQPLLSSGRRSQAQQQQATAGALAMAHCMRAHGITDYPDPNAQGDIRISTKPGSDLDPTNPRFKAANASCSRLMPSPQGGMTVSQGGPGGTSGSR
jgi:hypothetical protein